uniref:Uncharacterized protein n=1 Tax=Dicentrarchus labrax TaxID=13489 RepID=A0A8P4GG81_DICLA
MEQSFRIALCMCLLIGYLQATPVPTPQSCFEMDDLRFHLLHGSCKNNVTLTTPTNVKETCYSAAMERFMEGLERAQTECNGDNERFSQTLEALKVGNECYKHVSIDSFVFPYKLIRFKFLVQMYDPILNQPSLCKQRQTLHSATWKLRHSSLMNLCMLQRHLFNCSTPRRGNDESTWTLKMFPLLYHYLLLPTALKCDSGSQ